MTSRMWYALTFAVASLSVSAIVTQDRWLGALAIVIAAGMLLVRLQDWAVGRKHRVTCPVCGSWADDRYGSLVCHHEEKVP